MIDGYEEYVSSLSYDFRFDNVPTVEIHAKLQDGVLIDLDTAEKVELKNGAYLKIIIAEIDLPESNELHIHREISERIIAKKGEIFVFGFKVRFYDETIDRYDHRFLKFKLRIEDDLIMFWKGKKLARLRPCPGTLFDSNGKEDVEIHTGSFNSAFNIMSAKYHPYSSNHSCNVFKLFVDANGAPLEERRRMQFVDDGRNISVNESSVSNDLFGGSLRS